MWLSIAGCHDPDDGVGDTPAETPPEGARTHQIMDSQSSLPISAPRQKPGLWMGAWKGPHLTRSNHYNFGTQH